MGDKMATAAWGDSNLETSTGFHIVELHGSTAALSIALFTLILLAVVYLFLVRRRHAAALRSLEFQLSALRQAASPGRQRRNPSPSPNPGPLTTSHQAWMGGTPYDGRSTYVQPQIIEMPVAMENRWMPKGMPRLAPHHDEAISMDRGTMEAILDALRGRGRSVANHHHDRPTAPPPQLSDPNTQVI